MSFYHCRLVGLARGEEVDNILYYYDKETESAEFDTAKMGALGSAIEADVWPALAAAVVNDYQAQRVEVSVVNDRNETTSPFQVEVKSSITGGQGGALSGVGQVVIVGFRVGPLARQGTVRVPKRTYIAIGPLTEAQIGEDGELIWATGQRESLELALSQELSFGPYAFSPARVGVPNASNQPAMGAVVDAIARPYYRTRESRMKRASG